MSGLTVVEINRKSESSRRTSKLDLERAERVRGADFWWNGCGKLRKLYRAGRRCGEAWIVTNHGKNEGGRRDIHTLESIHGERLKLMRRLHLAATAGAREREGSLAGH